MSDTDPPHEVSDIERPRDRDVEPPDADADGEQVSDGHHQEHGEGEGQAEAYEPASWRTARQHDGADLIRDRGVRMPWGQDGGPSRGCRRWRLVHLGYLPPAFAPSLPRFSS